MSTLRVPAIHVGGRWWPSDEVTYAARCWLSRLEDALAPVDPCVVVLPPSAEGLALLVAASARPAPVVVLADDPRTWPDHATGMVGLRLALGPSVASLADEAARRGFRPLALPDPVPASGTLRPLQTAGFVVQTSGSTGRPKPVYRPTARIIQGASVRARALGMAAGAGYIGGVTYAAGQGLVQAVTAIAHGVPLGLLGPVDYRAALQALSQPEFGCWRATAHFADVLGRSPLDRVPALPSLCVISSPVSDEVFNTFTRRFGMPLRGTYSSTETGAIAVDAAPADAVRNGTVGRVLDGVEVSIGDDPARPASPGSSGRIWVRSPWTMAGYGMPPATERPDARDGWWPTRDLGTIDADGTLRLQGRIDDCLRTRAGRLVNLGAVAEALTACAGVGEAVVVPLEGAAGRTFGAVVELRTPGTNDAVRSVIGATLPPWALPRRLCFVERLPRLGNGKPDRIGCMAMLAGDSVPA